MAASRHRQLTKAGSRAPDFRLQRLDGGEAALADIIANGPALLAFFKVTCPVCQLAFPFLERLHSPGSLAIYGVSQNDTEDTRDFNGSFRITFPTLLDAEKDGFPVSNAFGISSVPTLFLLESDGSVSRVIEGWQKKEIELLAGRIGVKPFLPSDYVPEWKAG